MALPFIAGVAVGSLAIVAFNNKDKIKNKLSKGFEKGKEAAQDLKEYAQEKLKHKSCCSDCKDEELNKESCKKEDKPNSTTAKKGSTSKKRTIKDEKKD